MRFLSLKYSSKPRFYTNSKIYVYVTTLCYSKATLSSELFVSDFKIAPNSARKNIMRD